MVKNGYKRVYNVDDAYPVHPSLLTSTDDTTVYIHKGKYVSKRSENDVVLTSKAVDKTVHNIFSKENKSSSFQ
eukprot:9102247-Ditylum_brightwellii.AAC.1